MYVRYWKIPLELFENQMRSRLKVEHTDTDTVLLSTPWIQAMVPCDVHGGCKNPLQDLGRQM